MKAKNYLQIRKAYLYFSVSLLCTSALAVLLIFMYIGTAKAELALIDSKTYEYDRINAYQADMVDQMDDIYKYMNLLNSSEKINDVLLQNLISTKKMTFFNTLQNIPEKDALIYRKLASQINIFLNVKDSIRVLTQEEMMLKEELIRCIEDNKQLVRKLSIGGILIDRN